MASLSRSKLAYVILGLKRTGAYCNFVETGTYQGETAKWAAEHFENVRTIELSQELCKSARDSLKGLKNVKVLQGDSAKVLKDVLKDLKGTSVFWLDGHFSFGVTAGEERECPVLDELRCLDAAGHDDIILIDDAHMFLTPPPPPHKVDHWPSIVEVFDALRAVNPYFFILVAENVIVAVPDGLRRRVIDLVRMSEPNGLSETSCTGTHDRIFIEKGLWLPPGDLKLHLGCGETHLEGYVNIDYPESHHNVMHPKSDFCADIQELAFSDGVASEIRLHHVFEHFNRVTALAMLIRWHRWLKIGGILRIETPDIMGSAKTLLSDVSYMTKMGVVRHLAGDQSSEWGFHVDHWFLERFERTLGMLGFCEISSQSSQWAQEPFLSNIEITAVKERDRNMAEQLQAADDLLWESTVADAEKAVHEVWREQLRKMLGASFEPGFVPPEGTRNASPSEVHCIPENDADTKMQPHSITGMLDRKASRFPRTASVAVPILRQLYAALIRVVR